MALVMTQEGALRLLQWMLGAKPTVLVTVHLLGQPYTPHETSRISDLAANEISGVAGYTPLQLVSPAGFWTLQSITPGASGQYATLSWTFGGAATVYGYYVSDDTLPVSLWAELLAASYPYPSGGVFALQLALQLVNAAGVS